MTAGTRTFGISETFIEPQVLPPPPTRHALLAFLIVLAAIVHLGTAGWSEIHNGAEGFYAGVARDMLVPARPVVPSPDAGMLHWLILGSYKTFGVSPAAARFPVALAMIASITLTFLIGERLAGYWRGFAAGLIHLCCLGSFIWARIVTPAPLFAALLAATIFCAVCGYQRQQTRRGWFTATWGFAALSCMTQGIAGLLYPALTFLLLALSFREARLRFLKFFQWEGILLFLALVVPWYLAVQPREPGFFHPISAFPFRWPGVPISVFLLGHAAWSFPILFLVLPGACVAWRKVFRPAEFEFRDALPLCWMVVGFVPLLFIPQRQNYDSILMWGAFALWAASAWDRMPRAFRLAGICGAALVTIAVASYVALNPSSILPAAASVGWTSMLLLLGLVGVVAAVLAAYFNWQDRETLSIAILMLAMVPVGLTAAEAVARSGSHFSLASAARFVQPRLETSGEVVYEGSAFAASSLSFYLDKPFFIIGEGTLTEEAAMEKMGAPHPVYLIIHKDRVAYWQQQLTGKFHLYHQETTCGPHVVVSNQQ